MIFAVLAFGILLTVSALRNTTRELGAQLSRDVLGQDGFLLWAICLGGIGLLGYVPVLKTPSRYLLGLIFVVLILRNGGVFANAQKALIGASQLGPAPAVPNPQITSSQGGSGSGSGSSSGGSGSTLATVGEIAAIAAL